MHEDALDKRTWMHAQPSYGPAWDAAIDFGIDISLLEESLALTFEERLLALERMLALYPAEPRAEEVPGGVAPAP
jgi:hypothetical protein